MHIIHYLRNHIMIIVIQIISLSQSCIPLKSFNYIYNFLIKNDKGYFSLTSEQYGIFPLCNFSFKIL